MLYQAFGRQPCWAWALQDGKHGPSSSSSSRTSLPRPPLQLRRQNVRRCCAPQQQSCDASPASLVPSSNIFHQLQQQQLAAAQHPQQTSPQQRQQQGPAHPQHQAGAQQQQQRKKRQVADPVLLQQIKGCACWEDCLALLHWQGPRLDAMLLSALCTHSVHLYEVQQYHISMLAVQPSTEHPMQETAVQDSSPSSLGTSPSSNSATTTTTTSSSSTSSEIFEQYMASLADLSLRLALSGSFRPQQYSNVLWCFARCGYSLPPAWMHAFIAQVQQQLQDCSPRNLAQLIWATAALQAPTAAVGAAATGPAAAAAAGGGEGAASLPPTFLPAFLAATGACLPWFKPIDLANTLWGLAKLGVQPPPIWLDAALVACARCWSGFKPHELSISIWGFARLGVRFGSHGGLWSLQQPQQLEATAAVAAARHGGSAVQQGAVSPGLGWLLNSMALLVPAMGQQEIANLLWGLAVGKAALPQQHVQALGGQLCTILAQSLSPSGPFIASLTISLWALGKLGWSPNLPQAQILVRLLYQAAASGGLDLRHTALLLYGLGSLRLRPPAAAMEYLMACVGSGLPWAGMADLLQVLRGCHRLRWQISKPWWRSFYRNSLAALQRGTAAELCGLAAAVASHQPLKPTQEWWEVYWDSMGVELEAALAARGLSAIAVTTSLPRGGGYTVGVATAAAAAFAATAAASGARCYNDVFITDAFSASSSNSSRTCGSSSRDGDSDSSRSSSSSSSSSWFPDPLAWPAMLDALQIVTNLQSVSHKRRLQQQQQQQQQPQPVEQQQQQPRGACVTAAQAAVLLWACARLRRMPPWSLLWQLLLLVLTDVHAMSPGHLTLVLWSLGRMTHMFGRRGVKCYKLIRPLALVVQWRLMVGLAGGREERRRLVRALRYLADQNGALMSLLLLRELGDGGVPGMQVDGLSRGAATTGGSGRMDASG